MKNTSLLHHCGAPAARRRRRPEATIAALLCWWAALFASSAPAQAAEADHQQVTSLRIGFSSAMFTDINENDAKAAVKVWGQTIATEQGIQVDPDPRILKDTPALLQALRCNLVDALGITTVEYAALSQEVRFTPIYVAYVSRRTTEQYVLLTHRASKIDRPAGLRGRNLAFHLNPRVCLAPSWLDTLLVQEGFKPAAEFAGKVTRSSKLTKVVLPVFFRQSDACVVTRSALETMCELNPQIGKQLQVIATSPEVVPAVFCFRADYSPAFKEQLFAGIRDLHKTPAGQQVLTIFQSEKLEDQPASCLDSALEMLAAHDRILAPADGMAAPVTNLGPQPERKGQ